MNNNNELHKLIQDCYQKAFEDLKEYKIHSMLIDSNKIRVLALNYLYINIDNLENSYSFKQIYEELFIVYIEEFSALIFELCNKKAK